VQNIGSLSGQHKLGDNLHHSTKSIKILQSLEIAKLLIQHGADLEIEDEEGHKLIQSLLLHRYRVTSIFYSFHEGKKLYKDCVSQTLELLLQNGVKLISSSGDNAFTYTSYIKDAELLIKYNPQEINTVDKKGFTPLHHQIQYYGWNNDRFEIIKLMIEKGAIVEEGTDAIQLARDSMFDPHSFSIIEILLEKNPNYDFKKLNKYGLTFLEQYGNDNYTVKKLLDLGANLSLEKNNLQLCYLHIAIESKDAKLVEFIIKNGNTAYCMSSNILSNICELCLCTKGDAYIEWLQLLQNVLALPEMNDLKVSEPSYKHMFYHLFIAGAWDTESDKVVEILLCLSKSIKNVNSIEFVYPKFSIQSFVFQPSMNPCCVALVTFAMDLWRNCDVVDVKNFIENLVRDDDVSLKSTTNSVTLLTTLLIVLLKKDEPSEKEFHFYLIRKLIQCGINVESSVLKIRGGPFYKKINRIHIDKWKHMLKVPDVLFLSFAKKEKHYVEIFLSNWWAPPLVLLIFAPFANIADIELWLPVLLQQGGVPHGTPMYQALKKVLQRVQDEVKKIDLKLKPQEFQDQWQTCLTYSGKHFFLKNVDVLFKLFLNNLMCLQCMLFVFNFKIDRLYYIF
jgi:ankyrin repeat protein